MKTKHTKGKWNYHLDTSDEPVVADILTDGLSHWIAAVKVGGGGIDINKEEAEANAKLIAAAPELLEACIELINHKDNGVKIYDEVKFTVGMVDAMLKIQKAIKKATK